MLSLSNTYSNSCATSSDFSVIFGTVVIYLVVMCNYHVLKGPLCKIKTRVASSPDRKIHSVGHRGHITAVRAAQASDQRLGLGRNIFRLHVEASGNTPLLLLLRETQRYGGEREVEDDRQGRTEPRRGERERERDAEESRAG